MADFGKELSLFFYDNTNDPFSFLFFCYLCRKFFKFLLS